MPTICPVCGTEIVNVLQGCPACRYGSKETIQLTGSAGSMRSNTTIDIGQDPLTRRICGDDARFMEETKQFTLRKGDTDWFVCPNPAARNETFVNGAVVSGDTVINAGDEISIKGKAAFIKVSFV